MLPLTVDDLIYLLEGAQDTVIEVKTDSGKTFYVSNLRIPTDGGRITLYVKEYAYTSKEIGKNGS